MSSTASSAGLAGAPRLRRRRALIEAGSVMLAVVLLIWSLLPIYNMFLIALDPEEDSSSPAIFGRPGPSLDSFQASS